MDYMKDNKILHKRYVLELIKLADSILKLEENIVEVSIPSGGMVTICGDIHGQYKEVLKIFKLNGYPTEKSVYVFNGDFVDRGKQSIEVLITLLLWKCLYPKSFYLIRGNHENKQIHKVHG